MFSDVLLTVDYDHTMTDTRARIPQRNLEAVRYFMDHGGAFTLNTGRSVPMIRDLRKIVPVNAPMLLYNGSVGYDVSDDTLTFCHEIQGEMWETLREFQALCPGNLIEVQSLKAHYRFEECPMWDALCEDSGCAYAMAHPGEDLGPFIKMAIYGEIRTPHISDMFVGSQEEMDEITRLQEVLLARFGDRMEIFRPCARILDIHAKGVSKNRAAQELKEKLGRKVLVCVGDGENDVTMLNGADYAFCPGDATVADRYKNVCNCGDGAIADVIYNEIPKILAGTP